MNIETLIFLIFINIISFFMCGYDKYLAKKRKYRISEKNLILLSALGGFVGFLLASKIFRHKTKDKKLLTIIYFTSIIWIFIIGIQIYDIIK